MEKLIDVAQVFSRDIWMEFRLDKYAALILKQGIKAKCIVKEFYYRMVRK